MNFRIVVDTNVLVSAVLNPHGKPAAILNAIIDDDLNLITSPAILEEARRVFFYPKIKKLLKRNNVTLEETDNYIDRLGKIAFIVPGDTKVDVITDDPVDNIILACAIEGQANYIVSGDHHLTSLKIYQGIEITSAADLLVHMKSARP